MSAMESLNVLAHAADTVYKFATFNWSKKSAIQLIVAASILFGSVGIVECVDRRKASKEAHEAEETETCNED